MSGRTPRIATYGFFGMGNIGNEGMLAAFLEYLRDRHPEAEVSCFAVGPDAVRREHGIAATRLMAYRADPRQRGLRSAAMKALSRIWDVPRTFAMMRRVDILVVPGTGALESSLVARPWGFPFWLLLATVACRLRRRKVALVSVGGEYADHLVIRWIYRWTVRLAHYCSYRDEESRVAAEAMGAASEPDKVYPDLAFGLTRPPARQAVPGRVVVGVMSYDGNPNRPGPDIDLRATYLDCMTHVVGRLVERGCTVRLVIGDEVDLEVAHRIECEVRALHPEAPGEVLTSAARTLGAIMDEMVSAQVVVASRFHNLVCALKLSKPVVSLGYADKSRHLLSQFGLGEFSQALESVDAGTLLSQIDEVQRVQPAVSSHMAETLNRFDDLLERQFAHFSQMFLDSDPAERRRSMG